MLEVGVWGFFFNSHFGVLESKEREETKAVGKGRTSTNAQSGKEPGRDPPPPGQRPPAPGGDAGDPPAADGAEPHPWGFAKSP